MLFEGLEFADLLTVKGAVILIGAGVSSELGYLTGPSKDKTGEEGAC